MVQLRPTPNRVRETVFNWLRNQVAGAVCLDLFAGSGALGFEAASRGAARVVMVEQNRDQVAVLRRQVEILQAHTIEIVQADALQWLSATVQSFDLVFLDPPFATELLDKSLALLQRQAILRPDGLVYVESEPGHTFAADKLQIVKQGRAGQVQYMLLARRKEN